MIYNRTTWENSPSTSTPINAQNLNKIEQGITDAANEINAISHIVNVGTEVEEDYRVNFIHSRNLWKQLPNTQTLNGITLTNNGNGTFNLSGTATANTSLYVELDLGSTNLKNGTYTLSKKSVGYNIQLDFYSGTTYVSTPIYCYGSTLENSATLSIGSNVNKIRYIIYVANGSSVSLTNEEIMLNSGNEALPYEPYNISNQIVVDNETFTDTIKVSNEVDGKSRVNFIHSKNLCDGVNQSVFLTSAVNQGQILSGNTGLYIKVKGGNYTISTTTSQSRYRVACMSSEPSDTFQTAYNGVNKDGTSDTITIDTTGYRYLIVNATDLTKLQIEEGSTATTYSPFIPNQIVVDNETFTDTINVGTNVDGRSRVNVLHSKNLCTNSKNNDIIAKLESGTYTFSLKSSINGGFTLKKNSSAGDNIAPLKPISTGINSITFTISETTNVFLNGYSTTTGTGFADGTSELMLNKGSSALTYEPYTPPSINVDGDTFSETIKIGNEVDGKSRVNIIRQVNNILPKGTIHTITNDSVTLNFKVPKANTQYTMKTNLPATDGLALVFFGSGADAQVNSATNGVWVGSPRTMTSDANGYVTIAFRYLSGFPSIKLGDYWYTLAEGTLGVDYIAPSINVDGEEIYSKPVVLWQNSSPTSSFASQTINIGNYDKLDVIFKRHTSETNQIVISVYNDGNFNQAIGIYNNKLVLRQTSYTNNSLYLAGGNIFDTYGTPTSNDSVMIPIKIIGYK